MENPETSELTGRVFVLLQGPTSFFFAHLGRELRRRGARVIRVGFCPGDRLYWRKRGGTYAPYRKTRREFAEWITNLLVEENATDIVMLGDGRWPHASGIQAIRTAKLRTQVWIVEHGYLRPDLILIEPNGMGGGSEIPTLPVPAHDESGPAEPQRWRSSFTRYAALDIVYHMTNVLVSPIGYPHYRAHSGIHPFREYAGWIGKSLHARRRRRKSARVQTQIEDHEGPLFLYPLQLSHDMQLLKYGTGEDQTQVLEHVIASFSENAPKTARLVVKVHPLDNGLTDWDKSLASAGDRIWYLDGGDLDALLGRVSGVVTVNSTVGLTALMAGVPTLALGSAIYKAAHLSSPQALDDFWRNPAIPPTEKVAAFCRFLRTDYHVSGAFDGPGAPAGAKALGDWLVRRGSKTPEPTQ